LRVQDIHRTRHKSFLATSDSHASREGSYLDLYYQARGKECSQAGRGPQGVSTLSESIASESTGASLESLTGTETFDPTSHISERNSSGKASVQKNQQALSLGLSAAAVTVDSPAHHPWERQNPLQAPSPFGVTGTAGESPTDVQLELDKMSHRIERHFSLSRKALCQKLSSRLLEGIKSSLGDYGEEPKFSETLEKTINHCISSLNKHLQDLQDYVVEDLQSFKGMLLNGPPSGTRDADYGTGIGHDHSKPNSLERFYGGSMWKLARDTHRLESIDAHVEQLESALNLAVRELEAGESEHKRSEARCISLQAKVEVAEQRAIKAEQDRDMLSKTLSKYVFQGMEFHQH